MYEGDEINSGDGGSFDRPGAIVSSSPDEQQNAAPVKTPKLPKAPKPSKVEEPAPMFFQEPAPLPVAPVRERTRSKLPLFRSLSSTPIKAAMVPVLRLLAKLTSLVSLIQPLQFHIVAPKLVPMATLIQPLASGLSLSNFPKPVHSMVAMLRSAKTKET